jgi:hypothetical protein
MICAVIFVALVIAVAAYLTGPAMPGKDHGGDGGIL